MPFQWIIFTDENDVSIELTIAVSCSCQETQTEVCENVSKWKKCHVSREVLQHIVHKSVCTQHCSVYNLIPSRLAKYEQHKIALDKNCRVQSL